MSIEQPTDQNLISIGIFAKVHLLEGAIVRKGRTDYVDVKYYPNRDLVAYLQKSQSIIAPGLRLKWFQQIIEAVDHIHVHGVIHPDMALRQFFVDDDLNTRLGDFDSSQYPGQPALGFEKASHCLPRDYEAPNTVTSDPFALGSTLYELIAGKSPYSELHPLEPEAVMRSNDFTDIMARIERRRLADSKIEALYIQQVFPDVSCVFGSDVIMECWKGEFFSTKEALLRYAVLVRML